MTRKTISLLTLFSFSALILSSVALYVIPGGRTAPPEQLLLFGIHKLTWKNIHTTGGFLFISVAVWHTILNLRSLTAYVKKTADLQWKSAVPLAAATAITAFVYIGTVYGLEPMQTVLTAPRKLAAAKAANAKYKETAVLAKQALPKEH